MVNEQKLKQIKRLCSIATQKTKTEFFLCLSLHPPFYITNGIYGASDAATLEVCF